MLDKHIDGLQSALENLGRTDFNAGGYRRSIRCNPSRSSNGAARYAI